MSAYKRIKCKIVNKECLVQALKSMGLEATEYDKPKKLRGYAGDLRNFEADIIVSKENLNTVFTGMSNDLGFAWNESEKVYDVICSDYDINADIPQRVMQSYAVEVIKKAAMTHKFTIKENVASGAMSQKQRKSVKLVFGKVI